MMTVKAASIRMETVERQSAEQRMDALEQRIAKLEFQSRPLGAMCPKCRAFGFRFDRYGGQSLNVMKCRFCGFTEEKLAG